LLRRARHESVETFKGRSRSIALRFLPAGRFALPPTAATLLRWFLTDSPIDEGIGPWERNGHRSEHDNEQRHGGPGANGVVPVEIPGLAAKSATEPDDGPHVLPGPLSWEPEIDAGGDDEEEDGVGPSGDRAGEGSSLAFDRDPSVPGAHLCHEAAHAVRALTEHAAGIGVGVHGLSPRRD
jgi:hypothetical protein